jgi:hypothetical protein
LPEQIAELAKDAQQEGIEDEKEMWDQYREIDLAPMDPVMGDQIAGDLIMGTPVGKTVSFVAENLQSSDRFREMSIWPKARGFLEGGNDQTSTSVSLNDKVMEGYDNETGSAYVIDIPGHFNDDFQHRFRTRASVELIASFLRERDEALVASEADIDHLVKVAPECRKLSSPLTYLCRTFLIAPANLRAGVRPCYAPLDCDMHPREDEQTLRTETAGCDDKDYDYDSGGHAYKKQVLYQKDHISKIIGLIPGAMFWAVAQPIAHYSNKALGVTSKAYDSMLAKLTGVLLGESPMSE